jgi:hypothetical protein
VNENLCRCGKPTRDAAYVCEDCLSDLSRALGDVPWLAEQLDITLTRQRAAGPAGSPSPEKPMPFHVGAFDAANALRHALVTWIKFCDEEHVKHNAHDDTWPEDNMVSMSRWLMWRVDGLGLNDMGSEAVDEITKAVKKGHQVIDRPADRRYAGPCECGRDLYVKPGAPQAKCSACEQVWDVAELGEWMRKGVMGRLVTAREGATLLSRFDLETSQRTIDKWHERKRIVDHGHNAAGHRVYLIDDLLNVAAQNATPRSA